MPLFQAERCRALAAECRQLALAAKSKIEKTFLTNLAFSWNRLANQTDRYVEYLKTLKAPAPGGDEAGNAVLSISIDRHTERS